MKKWMVALFMTVSLINQSCTTNSNNHVIVQQGANLPISQLTIFVPFGSATLDTLGGETTLLKKMMAQSTLGQIIENHGGSYSINFSMDAFSFNITLLTEEMNSFLKEFQTALHTFTIESKDLKLAQKQVLEDIQSTQSNPNKRSYELFTHNIFQNHPYGKSKLGTQESIKNIKLEDIQTLYKNLLGYGQNIYFILASNQPNEFKEPMTKVWESFSTESSPIKKVQEVVLPTKEQSWSIKDNTLSQSFIHIGLLMPATELKQKHLLMMMQEIVGGGFNSRLFKILRAQYALSYSPHALFAPSLKADVFDIMYSTKSESTKESLKIIHSILEDLKLNGVTQDEFDTTKKLVLNNILKLSEDNVSLNQVLANDILYSRTLGSIKLLEQQVQNSSQQELNLFIKNLLKTYPIQTLILGA